MGESLEQKLDDDYLLWYDVPMGLKNAHSDFCVMHRCRGVLVLKVKEWKLGSTIMKVGKQNWEILGRSGPKTVFNPLKQACQNAHQVVNALQRDPQLVQTDDSHAGKLSFHWRYGGVFNNITCKQLEEVELQHTIKPHCVLCQDKMLASVGAEELQRRLWDIFPYKVRGVMSLPQLDRTRWFMFTQVRIQTTDRLFDDYEADNDVPSIMRVMDFQQEQLTRSVGDGNRVIQGVAGSGKTMILGYRVETMTRASAPAAFEIAGLSTLPRDHCAHH